MSAVVTSVSLSPVHEFSKPVVETIRLVAGLGVEGDAHFGEKVQHRSRMARNPNQPNLRQVHLIASELFDELAAKGFSVKPGDMGENISSRGIDLLALPEGARLHIGASAVVEITGLRNPCVQIDRFRKGLMAAVLDKDEAGRLILRAGVMGVVIHGGEVRPQDTITVHLPAAPHRALERV